MNLVNCTTLLGGRPRVFSRKNITTQPLIYGGSHEEAVPQDAHMKAPGGLLFLWGLSLLYNSFVSYLATGSRTIIRRTK